MRSILSIFLFSILVQNIITNKDNLNRMARASITLRNLVKYKKDLMRKLQASTDETPEGLNTVPTDIPAETAREAAKTLNPEPETFPAGTTNFLPETPKIEPKKNRTSGLPTGALFQIKKFHKFSKSKGSRKLNFNLFFSFFNKEIVKTIIMRVVIKYSTRRTLRGLADADADTIAGESIRTVCEIKPDYANLEGKKGTGDNIDYDCNGETTSDREVSDAKVDTSSPMVIGKESVPVNDIEFHEDSAEGANNLVNSPDKEMGVFNIQNWNTQDKNLILTGKVLPSNLLTNGKSYPVEFYDTQGEAKTIICTAQNSGSSCTLNCDTSENPLSTNVGNLALSKSDGDVYLTFNLPEGAPLNDPINAGASSHNTFYRKSSSGLSGGAIAGIVIACVVVLAAASIAAIMLRKPAPPVDNTTVVGLKTVENI